jgi:hypothetical protein
MTSLAAKHRRNVLEAQAAAVEVGPPPKAAAETSPTPPLALAQTAEKKAKSPALSPAVRHRQGALARLAADLAPTAGVAAPRPESGAEETEYRLLLAQLGEDMRRLKDIQSVEGKIAAKRDMLETYHTHIEATLAAGEATGKAVQDEIVTRLMLWHLDVGQYATGLLIAGHVLRFGLSMPESFSRTPAAIVAEQVAESALAALSNGKGFDIAILQGTISLTDPHDMHDQIRAKLHKALGLALRHEADASEGRDDAVAGAPRAARQSALTHLQRALALDAKVGVKKQIEQLTAQLAKAPAQIPAQDPEAEPAQ